MGQVNRAAVPPAVALAVTIPASLIDDFGDAQKAHNEFKPTEALYQKLRKELEGLTKGAPANQVFIECGKKWTLDISARANERAVPPAAVRKRLGAALLLKICTVTLKALEPYLLKPEIDALAVTEQTGSRTYSTTPRADC